MLKPLPALEIAARIPQQGTMCLLDSVLEWSTTAIACRAISHRDPNNPLRSADRLGAACGVEYAAQAMAVHGALLAETSGAGRGQPRQGYLASLRGVDLYVARLDDLAGDLEVEAELLAAETNSVLYRFSISHAGRCLLEGRAAVILDAAALARSRPS